MGEGACKGLSSATLSWINVIHFTSIFVKLKNDIITIHIFTNYYIKFFRNLRKFTYIIIHVLMLYQ